ncbi:class C sortase, partial [Leucobacter komagatae]
MTRCLGSSTRRNTGTYSTPTRRARWHAYGSPRSIDLPVYHGTSDATLLKGVGHLQGTSLSMGGDGTRAVLTGHRGLANATMFTHLDQVKVGDTFSVDALGEVFTYRVFDYEVVNAHDTEEIRAVPGKDLMTLITCTPLGVHMHRIIVTGERVTPTPPRISTLRTNAPRYRVSPGASGG